MYNSTHLRIMLKWAAAIVLILVCVIFAVYLLLSTSLRRASLTDGMGRLKAAYVEYTERGGITNYSEYGYQVSLSSNVVIIGGTQYCCFAEVGGGWGYEGGTLAMTTNRIFIWLDSKRPPKIVTSGHQPPLFSGRF